MLIFKSGINNQTSIVKYAFESFKYLTLTKAVLSPQLASVMFFTIKSNVLLTDRGYLNTENKNLQAMM